SLVKEAAAFGVRQTLEFHYDLTIEEVNSLYCRARMTGVFSRREGSCVAVSESLFADTPVVLMRNAHIGARKYINHETGRLADRRGLARTIRSMLSERTGFAPRAWALQNIP